MTNVATLKLFYLILPSRVDKCQESSTNNNLAESIKNSNLIIHIPLRARKKSDFNWFAKIKT